MLGRDWGPMQNKKSEIYLQHMSAARALLNALPPSPFWVGNIPPNYNITIAPNHL
jgi:hypothetical protein